ncbi:hypothetical protein SAMN05518865_11169 [Duganella sp. CF458]|uniref:hypothetical protein n=1 Tax=Duganella sp. CF458 TaxID=1884368 RepID=UPI0008E0ACF1|nr:hypothetical protein [Duganella sp. CF458]SFG35917.1 hypothetical protein SAMN05518865_11169 [Duganella sp. CF458]
MEPNSKDRKVNTQTPVDRSGGKRLPHERDESPQGATQQKTRSVIRQAAEDVEQGLVDTDLHGKPGLQKPPAGNESKANPLPGTKRD